MEFNSFDETDTSLVPLHFPDQNNNSERSEVGLKVAHDMHFYGGSIFRPEVRAAWQHEYNDT